jgi:4-amino-4-deoxy-L-arabinose transferase-like glycosyltransferase
MPLSPPDSSIDPQFSPALGPKTRWWMEPELGLLVLLVIGAFFVRMTDLSIRGEESRRALIAREMLRTGDFIVPRCQGVPLFSRPPLQNWLIALVGLARGDIDAVALRLPSSLALLLTVILIYGYSRMFLSRTGALTAGAAYASMGQVLELGRMGETDTLFTLFVSGSLLLWHLCYTRRASAGLTWGLGYALAGLGTLTKGPQGPVYFLAAVGAYLLWTGQWRYALSRGHAAGIALFCAIVGAWQVPFLLSMGTNGSEEMYLADICHRFLDTSWPTILEHVAGYPLEVAACMLPWSVLLAALCIPRFVRFLGAARTAFVFLATCLAVTFPTVWLPPGARPRYFFCLYPCAAVLAGIAAERLWRARREPSVRLFWTGFVRAASIAMMGAGTGILILSIAQIDFWLTQTRTVACCYALACGLLAALALRSLRRDSRQSRRLAVLAIAGFMALTQGSVFINSLRSVSVDTEGAVAALRRKLPADAQLVSYGQVHHLFVYYYRKSIPVEAWPKAADEADETIQYFCAEPGRLEREKLPFRWEVVADINCDRRLMKPALSRVIVGRRLDTDATADAPRESKIQ